MSKKFETTKFEYTARFNFTFIQFREILKVSSFRYLNNTDTLKSERLSSGDARQRQVWEAQKERKNRVIKSRRKLRRGAVKRVELERARAEEEPGGETNE